MLPAIGERILDVLEYARAQNAQDVVLVADGAPGINVDGALIRLNARTLARAELEAFVRTHGGDAARVAFERSGTHKFGLAQAGRAGSVRVQALRCGGAMRLVVRLHMETIPAFDVLNLPPFLASLAERNSGMIAFTGLAGEGKTVALNAMVDLINRTRACHVMTAESPVEYRHAEKRAFITQCEIGTDVASYDDALEAFLTSMPRVMVFGELLDRRTVEVACRAAETGHLVLLTIHTDDVTRALQRMVNFFPPEQQSSIRDQLAEAFTCVVGLKLVKRRERAHGLGRIAACEVLQPSTGIKGLIAKGRFAELRDSLRHHPGTMNTFEQHLSVLAHEGTIALDTARAATIRPHEIDLAWAASYGASNLAREVASERTRSAA